MGNPFDSSLRHLKPARPSAVRRHGLSAVAGAALAAFHWAYFELPRSWFADETGFGWAMLGVMIAPLTWIATWYGLYKAGVARPGWTVLLGLALTWCVVWFLARNDAMPYWAVIPVTAVAFLVAALFTS
ncbi:hypothetical protein GCM10022243_02110 [Saccharothrix violaceirubra]|uniref:Uncharacterized protein n=1 Tax=Saccharothrix violaceirubra TaxID=413306 RepID=A0A7W7T667_9PSEU|nr:hypothetical protein [Saccharothrix violaceirubra]MBB4965970.1 hypothetical protein [Saccharothrix violaceirubra]